MGAVQVSDTTGVEEKYKCGQTKKKNLQIQAVTKQKTLCAKQRVLKKLFKNSFTTVVFAPAGVWYSAGKVLQCASPGNAFALPQ
jgi:hypothetical protein